MHSTARTRLNNFTIKQAMVKLRDYITEQLKDMAAKDENFKARYEDKDKSMDECVKYIFEQAQKQAENNCAAIDNDEVLNWAVHYYQEKDCKPKGNVVAKVKASSPVVASPVPAKPQPKKTAPKAKKAEPKAKFIELNLFD